MTDRPLRESQHYHKASMSGFMHKRYLFLELKHMRKMWHSVNGQMQ
ncbi:hypothetical protein FOTG_14187 [Fusarium oxysporum f. sp. vasinfectum 25433]|uniref:Uncharacterized protein n=1 Tax=Fusarium oxysporum f. sp. vasinfectum 25433 TaxID=1089449 RepID=X0KVJ0_FUSOX|nr:hypothetical protein FOTG_14187 [Fusarium oxysporum f. sp. vasinfectum 25433]